MAKHLRFHVQLKHNWPELCNVSQLEKPGTNQTVNMLVQTHGLVHINTQIDIDYLNDKMRDSRQCIILEAILGWSEMNISVLFQHWL